MAAEGKPPWKELKVEGDVEAKFLYATTLNKDLFPFALRCRAVVLPLMAGRQGQTGRLIDQSQAVRQGDVGLAGWLEQVEKLWREHKKATTRMTIYERLDYHKLLSGQKLSGTHKVLYNTSGTHLVAAVVNPDVVAKGALGLPVQAFLADHKTYVCETQNREEAHYLAAVLNSPTANQAIKPFQTRGLFGARDIHRRPLEVVPIPAFDSRSSVHRRLAALGTQCQVKAEKAMEAGIKGGLVKVRAAIHTIIAKELEEIDKMVGHVLANPASNDPPPPRGEQTQMNLG